MRIRMHSDEGLELRFSYMRAYPSVIFMRLILVVIALLASACTGDSADAPPNANSSAEPTSETVAASTSDGDCLLGTWQIDPASMDLDKVEGLQNIPNADFSVGESSGRALITFESDGDAVQAFEDFSVTINAAVSGMQMSVRNDYSGTATGTYAVEDDRIVMEPTGADLSVSVSVNGGAPINNPMGVESLFAEGERGRTAFTCSGDELLFTIHSPDSAGGEEVIRDVRYTRVSG